MPPHRPASYSEKMRPILPISILGIDEPNVDLVYQLRRLQGMTLAFAFKQISSQAPQVWQYKLEQFVFCVAVALTPSMQELGDIRHICMNLQFWSGRHYTRPSDQKRSIRVAFHLRICLKPERETTVMGING